MFGAAGSQWKKRELVNNVILREQLIVLDFICIVNLSASISAYVTCLVYFSLQEESGLRTV